MTELWQIILVIAGIAAGLLSTMSFRRGKKSAQDQQNAEDLAKLQARTKEVHEDRTHDRQTREAVRSASDDGLAQRLRDISR